MTCRHCPPAIEKALRALDGVRQASVNSATTTAHIAFDPNCAAIPRILDVVRSAGYIPGAAKVRIPIANMHCASCATRIERELAMTAGVIKAAASLMTNAVDVEYHPEQTSFEALTAAIERAGYRALPQQAETESEVGHENAAAAEYRLLMRKFWFAAAISVPVLLLSYPDYIPGLRDWMPMGSATRRIVMAALGVLSLPVIVWSGSQFFTGAWDALKHRAANMNTLIAVGISAAFLYSVVAVAFPQIFPRPDLAEAFWDVATVVIALVVFGLALEIKAKGRTSEAIKKLIGLQAKTARVLRNGKEIEIPMEEVLVGDAVVIRPGGKIPVDGEVLEGASAVDEVHDYGRVDARRKARRRGSDRRHPQQDRQFQISCDQGRQGHSARQYHPHGQGRARLESPNPARG